MRQQSNKIPSGLMFTHRLKIIANLFAGKVNRKRVLNYLIICNHSDIGFPLRREI